MEACPMCVDGYDPHTGHICEVCYGHGYVVPGSICRCGRSAPDRVGSVTYCGRDACIHKLIA
jgi:hypothetical protein